MNGPMAFCPNCKKDVLFVTVGSQQRCSVCGAEFRLSQPPVIEPDRVGNVVMTIGHVILRVILIFGVVVLVGIAVLFASCAFH
jgi:uncharacterized protein (DUF983 family)